ncbi:MAG: glycosyl transferase family protein [Betaproteobacteria bacterium]|nr:glycosyl transferase family protein [Betaproteobacteria bacterium]
MTAEHPFAQYIRILGKGRQGSRSLSQDEARAAMQMILRGDVEPLQLGAFLTLERMKEETPEELAGFVQAVQASLPLPDPRPEVMLDWSSYAGKRRQLPWFLLSALLLAANGVKVFMHGADGPGERVYTPDALRTLGLEPSKTMADAAARLNERGFAFMDLSDLCPRLDEIMRLRPLLGLRSPVHTLARMMNPFRAPVLLQGIFHPGYRDIHQHAAAILGQPHVAVLKGEGGEIERNPDSACLVKRVDEGVLSEEEWPAMFPARHMKDESMAVERLAAVWRGEVGDEYGEAAVVGTAAIALRALGRAGSIANAEQMAAEMWKARVPARLNAA